MNLGILLIYGRHLNDRITSQRREAWAHTTRIPFSTLLLNCLHQVSKVCGHVYVYVLGVKSVNRRKTPKWPKEKRQSDTHKEKRTTKQYTEN
jgi:hypothetical protein